LTACWTWSVADDEAVPYRFPGTVGAGTLAPRHADLAPGESSGEFVAVAGRLMRNRPSGRLVFADLRDWTGSIQLFSEEAKTERFAELAKLSLGDWVGARGEVIRTRRGELSVAVREWELLAKARRGFGDKWAGVNDVELRHRQREVDLWANEGVRERFLLRARVVSSLRRRLEGDGFVEVETPILQPLAGGGNARPFRTEFNALHADFFLRIAPELYLKRLVVGGFERVFEIGRVFRNEGLSPRHNPEFTMLEAYAVHADYLDMATLVENLIAGVALDLLGTTALTAADETIDLRPPWKRQTLTEAIAAVTGVEATLEMGEAELRRVAAGLGVEARRDEGAGGVLYEIYEKTTELKLTGPVHVMDYPIEVSPLTRAHRSRPGYAERITPVIGGREIGEIYSELVDPDEQRARLVAQAARREAGDEEAMVVDEDFLRALEHGMPPTGGIGIGIDRLLMVLGDVPNIREVILFPALRPERASSGDEVGGAEVGSDDEEGGGEDR
jgi:lysyl-tRNA synthetase class 2